MKTLKQKIKDLENSHKVEVKQARIKNGIMEKLPAIVSSTGKGFKLYFSELYGRELTCTIGDSFRSDTVTLEQVLECLELFKPLPLKKYRDGFCSFRIESYIDKNEETATIEKIKPLQIKVSNPTYGSPSAELSYFTKINNHVIELRFYVPSYLIGHIDYNSHNSRHGYYIDNIRLTNKIGGRSLQWGRGSNEYVSDFTIYDIDGETLQDKINK